MNMKSLEKGSIVKYNDGYYRITALFKETANLGAVFGGHIYHKKIPLFKMVESEEEWYKHWTESETYKCM